MNYQEKFRELYAQHIEAHKQFNTTPATARIDPFMIADGLYYVGDKHVCSHLIDTGDGLIVIDTGYLGATHLLVDSIWRAGFDPKNVKWIIHTHGHYDHFGASNEFKAMYGTKLAISRADAEYLREKPHRALINKDLFPLAKVPEFDYEIEDGEIFELGNVKIKCVLTPGHTRGVLSLFFDVTSEGKTYLAGLFGGIGTKALTLPFTRYDEEDVDRPRQILESIEKIKDEKVVVHLGNHPDNNNTLEKREKQIREGGNPFIDENSWKNCLAGLKITAENIAKDNDKIC